MSFFDLQIYRILYPTVNHYSSVLEDTGGGGGGGRYSSIGNTTAPLLSSTTNNNNTASEVRQLRFENLILQSKVETLEAENKKLREVCVSFLLDSSFFIQFSLLRLVTDINGAWQIENRTNYES